MGPQYLSLHVGTDISSAAVAAVARGGPEDHSRVPKAQAAGTEEPTQADPEVLEAGEDTGAELGH